MLEDSRMPIMIYSGVFAVVISVLPHVLNHSELRSDAAVSCCCALLVITARVFMWNAHAPGEVYSDSQLETPTVIYCFQCIVFMMISGLNLTAIVAMDVGVFFYAFMTASTGASVRCGCLMVLFSGVAGCIDCAAASLVRESEMQHRSKTVLLDNISDGFCTVKASTGNILSSSTMLNHSFETDDICGCNLQDLISQDDWDSLTALLDDALEGRHTKAFLATCQARHANSIIEFDAKIIPYATSEEELSLCFVQQGERRQLSASKESLLSSPQGHVSRKSSACMPHGNSFQPPSVKSAPAAHNHVGQELSVIKDEDVTSGDSEENQADCLPIWSKVRVQVGNVNSMKSAGELNVGDLVQCYDHLQQGVCFVPVTALATDSGSFHWVEVTLTDGTRTVTTPDHPIRCNAGPELFGMRTVVAGDLLPGQDMLRVFKVEQTTVQEVKTYTDATCKVSIGLAHSERYSLFVSSREGQPAVAVESGNYTPFALNMRNTFLGIADDASAYSRGAASAPPVLRSSNAASTLSEMQHDLPSTGSQHHHEGMCKPCRFQYRHQTNPGEPPCQNFEACLMCHAEHDEEFMRRYRNYAGRMRRSTKRQGREDLAFNSDADQHV